MNIFVKGEFIQKSKTENRDRVYVRLSDGRKMSRARFNMMKALDVDYIPTYMNVHHIDGSTFNDDIDNLMLVTKRQHQSIHHPKDYKYGASYSENSTLYAKFRRLIDSIKNSGRKSSLKWYHKNKDKANSEEKKRYRKDWYILNSKKISEKNKQKYANDPEFRAKCLLKAKQQKLKRKEKRNEITVVQGN